MDLKIKDVAELLKVSESTIHNWLQDGKIPAYKLNSEYHFSKIEIENWMLEQKFSPTKEEQIYPVKESGNKQYSLYRALNRGGILLDVEGSTKEELIRNSMDLIAPTLRIDASVVTDLLLDREKLAPTAFNNGVAVPHARECLSQVPFDLISIVLSKQAVAYGALDEKPVDVLFFLFATGDKMHLHLLSKIAHLSSSQETLAFLRSRPAKSKLLEFIKEWESNLKV